MGAQDDRRRVPDARLRRSAGPALTPQQLASRILSHVSANTSVTMGDPLYVAGQPAYQLIVAPKSAPGSTVDHVEIDVGASGALLGVPLQVAVYAQGQVAAALELGFTGALHLGTPPAAELSFTPPPGPGSSPTPSRPTAAAGSPASRARPER